MATKVIC